MLGETVRSNQRHMKFMTKNDKEDLRKESVLTQTTLPLKKNQELIIWAKTAAEKLRGELEDENGETHMEQVSLSLEEEENPKRQYGNRHTAGVWTDGSAFYKEMSLVAAAAVGIAFARNRVQTRTSP